MKALEQFALARDTEAQPASKCEIEKLDRSFRSRLCASAQEFLWSIQEARSYASNAVIFRMGDPPDGITCSNPAKKAWGSKGRVSPRCCCGPPNRAKPLV